MTATAQNQATTNGAIAKPSSPVATLRELLEKSKEQIALALPKHMTPERMIRVAITVFHRTPQLQKCTPLSVLGCVIQASELGLELSGPLGQAYMVPRWNKNIKQEEAIFQVGYRGFIDLAYRTGRVNSVPLRTVYTNDAFEYGYGTSQFIRHTPNQDGPPPVTDDKLTFPDNIRAVYCVFNLKNGACDFEVMTAAQVEAHRRQYCADSYKETNSYTPWKTAWPTMAMKTACRKVAKRVPLSIEFQKAVGLDEYGEAGIRNDEHLDSIPAEILTRYRMQELAGRLGSGAPQDEPSQDTENQPTDAEPAGENLDADPVK